MVAADAGGEVGDGVDGRARVPGDLVGVDAGSARQGVHAIAIGHVAEGVVTRAAEHLVSALIVEEGVIATVAMDDVVAGIALDIVVVLAALEVVIAGAAIKVIIA